MWMGWLFAAVWLALLGFFVWRRAQGRLRRWCASIAFVPTERMSSHQLCGCLLSANLAVLSRDNFNQLASTLPPRRARRMLAQRWDLKSAIECRRGLEAWLTRLGAVLPDEAEALAAWRGRAVLKSETYLALRNVFVFLCGEARVIPARRVAPVHLSMLAWDIQQVAYIARLGFTAGHLSRDMADSTLARLQCAARAHYATWADYSVSTLVGWGLRARIDPRRPGEWRRIAETHRVLLGAPGSPVHRVAFCDGPLVPRRARNSPARLEPRRSGPR